MPRRRPAEIIKDPHVMGGLPVIRGTRVPAHFISWLVAQGVPELDILQDYPSLYPDDIRAAVEYAEAHPEEDY